MKIGKKEKNIPIPAINYGKEKYQLFPVLDLEIGESKLFEELSDRQMKSARGRTLAKMGTLHNRKFSQRKLGENSIRVWRIF